MGKQSVYSKYAVEAACLMGEQIRLGRKQRQWTESALADRAGISRATLQKIEKGDMSCAIGSVFEVAALVGIKLFESDTMPLAKQITQTRDKIAVLPQKIKAKTQVVRDDF